ncbi:MAG: hypothetical protein ABSF79_10200 [Smithellaceae bacterium]|jgi:hypothetical protein
MKIRIFLFSLILLFTSLSAAHTKEYGKIRALQQRAAYVTKQKNDFVARVLTSYKIPHEKNDIGAIVRINMEGQRLSIKAIEIIPLTKESADKRRHVVAHELFFYTDNNILDLVSELTIR